MKFRFFFSLVSIIFCVFLLYFFWWKNIRNYEKTDNAYIRGSITNIASRIDGYVLDVPGVLNNEVKKGDMLVKFDPEPFEAKYYIALADLDSSKAMILEVEAMLNAEKLKIEEKKLSIKLASSKTNAVKAKKLSELSNLDYFKKNKNRMEKLYQKGNTTKSKLDKAIAEFDKSIYKVQQLSAEIKAKEIDIELIENEIEKLLVNVQKLLAEKTSLIAKKQALDGKVKAAFIDLKSTNILSPISGIIANRIVEPGVYMKKGWPLMSVVPTKDVWVIANFKETQLKNIKANHEAIIYTDAYPKVKIKGKVLSISPASASSFSILPPQNASGNFVKVVQRVPIKITMEVPLELLGKILPGMSVVVKVLKK